MAAGTQDASVGPAMTREQCAQALANGMAMVRDMPGNVLLLGEMGIGNTSVASLLLARLCGVPLADCVGAGTGLDAAGIAWEYLAQDVTEFAPEDLAGYDGVIFAAPAVTADSFRAGVPRPGLRDAVHGGGAQPDDGVAVVEADLAGFWVGRAFPTAVPRSVVVATTPLPGFAAAGALMARLAGRPSIGVRAGGMEVDGGELEPEVLALSLIHISEPTRPY